MNFATETPKIFIQQTLRDMISFNSPLKHSYKFLGWHAIPAYDSQYSEYSTRKVSRSKANILSKPFKSIDIGNLYSTTSFN